MRLAKLLTLISISLIATVAFSQPAKLHFRKIDVSDGLSNNHISSIYASKDGFLWCGTLSGLDKFDGYTFRKFNSMANLPGNPELSVVSWISEDYDGILWLFTRDNTVVFFDPKTETFSTDHEAFHYNIAITPQSITGMVVDTDGNLWMADSQKGIYKYDRKEKKIDLLNKDNSLSDNGAIALACDSKGYIWSVNRYGILEKIDKNQLKVVKRVEMGLSGMVSSNYLYKIFIDSDDDIWLFSSNNTEGLHFYSDKQGKTVKFSTRASAHPLNNDIVTSVVESKKGTIWVGTDHGGINMIDKSNMSVSYLVNDPTDNNSLANNSVYVHRDQNGIIWVGTFKNGINYYHPEMFQFGLTQHFPLSKEGLPYNDINCFTEDSDGNLWIGTNGFGLIKHNRRTGSYQVYRHNPNDPNSISSDIVVCLTNDHNNHIWAGTYYGGLNRFDGKKFTRFMNNPNDPTSLSDNRIWQIMEDSKRRLWIGSLGGGLMLYQPATNSFKRWRNNQPNSIHSDFVQALAEDINGNIWVGTSNGLELMNPVTEKFRYIVNTPNSNRVLSDNNIVNIIRDHRNWMWMATRNGVSCYDAIKDSFKIIGATDGLPAKSILTILEDGKGNLWLGTLNGLSNLRINPANTPFDIQISIRNYNVVDGLQGSEFNEYSAYKTRDGEFYFGGPNGLNHFHPDRIIENSFKPKVIFSGIQIKNKEIAIGEKLDGNVILKKSITYTESIKLKYSQNSLSIHFTALQQLHPEKARFRYMLEGFDNEWVETEANNRTATYTNLSPGKYLFRIKASGGDGLWSDNETTLKIMVSPPLYATLGAYILYIALILLAIWYSHKTVTRREKQKYLREQEKKEHQRMHEIDNIKIKFFTNISHEFRTPLTLILTPIERLIKKTKDDEDRSQLVLIQRNGRRLLNLINQLLDFRKLEVQEFKLHADYGNIVAFLKDTAESFSDLAEYRSIKYKFKSCSNQIFTSFDQDKVEKILFNLLSNAFKFTQENGTITVSVNHLQPSNKAFINLFDGKDYIEIKVEDSGIGIPFDKQERIFERFFQNESNGTVVNQGSGIGLALTQEYVKVHGGTITVKSEPEKGSVFVVRIPVISQFDNIAPENNEFEGIEIELQKESREFDEEENHSQPDKPLVVLVEDNEDLRFYLKENLKKNYTIVDTGDGKSAWGKIQELQPTLVVSDIMMPGIDGLQLCEMIKSDPQTSHIPVILLSARANSEQRLEGLQAGADDYIAKPFNYEILELKIKKLIEQRLEFQKTFTKKFEIKPGEINITSLDEKFIQKAIDTVEKHISDTEFTVEKMSRELGLSRGHLYNKIMSLTGKTPVEFIRIMRLKRAAQLLEKSQMTVSEIAFHVGFNDPKYFSKYFKNEFNMLPSKYADQYKKGEK